MDKVESIQLTTLPTELRLQILSTAVPSTLPTPAWQSPSTPLHGVNPLLRVSRQIRDEALSLPQPTSVVVVNMADLDRDVGRRNVDERDLFRRLMVRGIKDDDAAKDVEAMLRECWMLVQRVDLRASDEEFEEDAVCFQVRGACTAWSHYPWYMQAG